MEKKKLRIGIIGTGGIAHAHANAYKQFDDVEIVAGADIIPGKARKFLDEFGWTEATAYENHEELCGTQQRGCPADGHRRACTALCQFLPA